MHMTLFHRLRLYVPLALATLLTAGCSGTASRETSDNAPVPAYSTPAEESVPIDESTLIADSASTAAAPANVAVPPRRFSTREQAVDFMERSGHGEEYRTGILPRMLDDNFAYADRLLNNPHDYFIVADKQSMHVILYDRYGRQVKAYPMACARNFGTKHRKGDCRTPEGFFVAQGIYDSSDWLYTDDNGYTSPTKGVYGPRFIRIKADVTGSIGIHGTGSPGSVGKRVSHGCIRINNASILDLVKYVKAGMPIIVNPGDRDMAVNRREGYDIIQIATGLEASATSRDVNDAVADDYAARPARPDSTGTAPAATDTIVPIAADNDSITIPAAER